MTKATRNTVINTIIKLTTWPFKRLTNHIFRHSPFFFYFTLHLTYITPRHSCLQMPRLR